MSEAYEDWTTWPLLDILEYADEIANSAGIDPDLRPALRESMWQHAGYGSWMLQGPAPRVADYPRLLGITRDHLPDDEERFSDEEWHDMLRRYNEPYTPSQTIEDRATERAIAPRQWELRGDGLTRRWISKTLPPWHVEQARMAKAAPFRHEVQRMRLVAQSILWRSGYFCVSGEHWIGPVGLNEPYVGLYWYFSRVVRWGRAAIYFAGKGHSAMQRALFCAARMGSTFAEMEIRAQHNSLYTKAERTRASQSEAGARSRKATKEAMQAAWWKYRRMGYTAVKAGEQAGTELGVSERTIRRAFDDEYPEADF